MVPVPVSTGSQQRSGLSSREPRTPLAHLTRESYAAAFLERYLKGNTGYDTYLTGAIAPSCYIVLTIVGSRGYIRLGRQG